LVRKRPSQVEQAGRSSMNYARQLGVGRRRFSADKRCTCEDKNNCKKVSRIRGGKNCILKHRARVFIGDHRRIEANPWYEVRFVKNTASIFGGKGALREATGG